MFKSSIKISKPGSTVTSFDGFSIVYSEIIGAQAEAELNYIRSDHILEGLLREEAYKNWNNDTKTAELEYYHDTAEGMKAYQVTLTENELGVLATQRLHEAGWTVTIDAGKAEEGTSKANKIHTIDEWSLCDVRPEKRQAILDKISQE